MPHDATDDDDQPREITAAGRVLAILEVFRLQASPLTLSEISKRSGLTMTTSHRLTRELLDWGALERTEDGHYQLGTKLLDLATSSGNAMKLRERAIPSLLRLHQMLRGLVVHLSIRDGFETVYVESLRSGQGTVSMNRIGGRMPLHVSSTGRVLLAYADPGVQERFLARPLQAFTPYTVVDPDQLRSEFVSIRKRQSVTTTAQVTMNTGGVASPVFDRNGQVIAAVGIVVTLQHNQLEDHVPLVRATAARITRALHHAADDQAADADARASDINQVEQAAG